MNKNNDKNVASGLTGKVALVTGASSGIGAGIALHFASLGCKLSLCGRNKENLLNTAKECGNFPIQKSFQNIKTIVGDLENEADAVKAVEETIAYFGKLDILINSAGILLTGSTADTPLETYDKVMNINTRSVFYLMQLAIPHLIETKGNIVNISSIAGTRSFPGIMAYCTSKAAVDQITRCAALELASEGVRVNAVNPGVIITEIHKRGGMSEQQYAEFLEKCKTTHALGRPGTTDEVAKAVEFLVSDNSSFITGVTLPIDGGRSVMCPR